MVGIGSSRRACVTSTSEWAHNGLSENARHRHETHHKGDEEQRANVLHLTGESVNLRRNSAQTMAGCN
eukprot:scaffold44_cov411-Prasinococcus_capsulatus_cf.AAC.18